MFFYSSNQEVGVSHSSCTNTGYKYVRTVFKRHETFQDVLCRRDYYERLVASFTNQKKSEYYGGNISVSIEGIALEHFSALPKT